MIQLKKSNMIAAMAILMLLRPVIIMQYAILDVTVSMIVNAALACILVLWIMSGLRSDRWILQAGVFFLTLIISTITNGGTVSHIVSSFKIFLAILVWFFVFKKKRDVLLPITKNVLFILVLLNMITMIAYPNGLIQLSRVENEWNEYNVGWWLFGNKNGTFLWIYMLNILAHISIYSERNHVNLMNINVWMIATTIITAFLSKSSTTIITIVMLTVLPLIYRFSARKIGDKLLTSKTIIIGYLVFTIILVTSNQLGIFKLVSGIFNKDITFTGRTTAWAQAILLIMNRPLLGYGVLGADRMKKLLGAFAFVNTHNTMLQSLFDGGIFLGIQYLLIYYGLCGRIEGLSENLGNQKRFLMLSMAIIGIAISFEAYTDNLMFWNLLTLIYYVVESLKINNFSEKK